MKNYVFISLCFFGLLSETLFAQSLVVIRHGESLSNTGSIVNGDPLESEKYPLTEKGMAQVASSAKELSSSISEVRWVYVSPLLRTRQTAQILMKNLNLDSSKMILDYTITESGMGSFEGRAIDPDLMRNPDWAKQFFGESQADVSSRVKAFLNRVKVLHPQDTILVVTHGTPMVEIVHALGNASDERIKPQNAEFRIIKQ
jgi:broad specificity phosphatase PhoE